MLDDGLNIFYDGDISPYNQGNVLYSVLQLLDRSSSSGIIITDANSSTDNLIYINSALTDLLGYSYEEIKQLYHHDFSDSMHPDDLPCFRETVKTVITTGKDGKYIIRFRKKSGDYRWFSGCLKLYSEKAVRVLIGFYIDINELVETKDRLEINNKLIAEQAELMNLDMQRFKSAVQLSGMSFFEIDLVQKTNRFFDGEDTDSGKHRITFSFTSSNLDFTTPESRNGSIKRMVSPDDTETFIKAVESIYDEKAVSFEARVLADDGQYYWCRIKMSLILNSDNVPSRVLGTIVNINDAKFKAEMMEMKAERAQNNLRISQIGTHFFYHILSTIRSMTRTDPQMAGDMLYDVSKYLRYKTDGADIAGSIIPFSQELKSIRSFVNLKKVIFKDKLTVCYDICDTDFCLPVLTVQPLVENAIEHGIEKKAGGGTVWIKATEETDCFQIIVKDDGVGYDHTIHINNKTNSVSQQNIEKRLAFYGENDIAIDSIPGQGTTVTLKIRKDLCDKLDELDWN